MTGPELDLLEHGDRGGLAAFNPGSRVEFALSCENALGVDGESLRPWATFIITANADYVSSLAMRAQLLALDIHKAPIRYQRYYQLRVTR
jgi:hypothetical protein